MKVTAEALRKTTADILTAAGLSREASSVVTDVLVDAELRGIASHGLTRLSSYVERIKSGAVNRAPNIRAVVDSGSVVLLDGDYGMGHVVSTVASDLVAERACDCGIAAVSVRHSGHFGTAGYYARRIAARGLLSWVYTNASAGLAPWNGMDAIVGNNPWAIALPSGSNIVCLDLANSVAARGKIRVAADKGEAIPEGWAVGPDGSPTTNPRVALEGALLPMAGHKGYGITVMVEMVSAVLAGASTLDSVVSPRDAGTPQDVGHLFMAMDFSRLVPKDEWDARMAAYEQRLKSSRHAPKKEILLPGQPEDTLRARRLKEGIDVSAFWGQVEGLAQEFHVEVSL